LIIELTKHAEKDLSKMDPGVADALLSYLQNHIAALSNPRSEGRALEGEWHGFWRYRHGDYRLICDILDTEAIIVAVKIGHRRNIYR
jgi:mRNA interferase RelE/StbE